MPLNSVENMDKNSLLQLLSSTRQENPPKGNLGVRAMSGTRARDASSAVVTYPREVIILGAL